jgi:hypothetical protein
VRRRHPYTEAEFAWFRQQWRLRLRMAEVKSKRAEVGEVSADGESAPTLPFSHPIWSNVDDLNPPRTAAAA